MRCNNYILAADFSSPLLYSENAIHALFQTNKGGETLNSWKKSCQDGYIIVDRERKIAIKPLQQDESLVQAIQHILLGAFLEHLTKDEEEVR